MLIVYTPEGSDRQVFNAGRMRTSEIQIIERTADRTWNQILKGLESGDITAMRTVGWVLAKRSNPALRIAEFDPFDDELRVKLDDREIRDYAAHLFTEYGGTPELDDAWDELRAAAFDAEACEAAIKEAVAPKEPAPTVPAVTEPTAGSPTEG